MNYVMTANYLKIFLIYYMTAQKYKLYGTIYLNWLLNVTNIDNNFSKKAILIGDRNNDPIIVTVIMLTKHEIYKRKWKRTFLNLNLLKHAFKSQMESDKDIGTINNTLPRALGKWSASHNVLRLI